MKINNLTPGDFTQLAVSYNKYRPAYSNQVILSILNTLKKPFNDIAFSDIGAGTGIWTRQVARYLEKPVIAVEPNEAMRGEGSFHDVNGAIDWRNGCAENTGLPTNSMDLISMASSFHWANFELATTEFHRVLKPGGSLIVVWNPRVVNHSLFESFEAKIQELAPAISRVSSGKSNYVEKIAAQLGELEIFSNMKYFEGRHTEKFNRDRYVGVWQSVNDVRAQMGEEKFSIFIDYVNTHFPKDGIFECEYLTRAWVVQAV